MKINSITAEYVCNVTGRVESSSKTSFTKEKPDVPINARIFDLPVVIENLTEKHEMCAKYFSMHATIRTNSGVFKRVYDSDERI